jgi:hypothetical protein
MVIDPLEIDFAGKQYACSGHGLDEELVSVDLETAPLLRTVPILIP